MIVYVMLIVNSMLQMKGLGPSIVYSNLFMK